MNSMERLVNEATSAMYPGSKDNAYSKSSSDVDSIRNRIAQIADGQCDSIGEIWLLRGDIRSEFRNIYESIIDSTIAAMY